MKRWYASTFLIVVFNAWFCHSALAASLDSKAIAKIIGVSASNTSDGVTKVTWPRTDVPITVDGVALKPFAGLTSWAAFSQTAEGAIMMGDTVVFQDEVNPAMDAAFAAGLEVTGLHNHFLFDEPKVYFMHIGGHGESETLAHGVKAVWNAIKNVRAKNPTPAASFAGPAIKLGQITAEPLEKIIGAKGQTQDGMVKFSFDREGKMHGVTVGGAMGLNTWAAFSGTDAAAVVDGDFIMTANEVQPVLRSLRKFDIKILALHNHMIGEEPMMYFTHFWGKGRAADLAKALRATLEAQKNVDQAH